MALPRISTVIDEVVFLMLLVSGCQISASKEVILLTQNAGEVPQQTRDCLQVYPTSFFLKLPLLYILI
ncbi:hypothetical protein Trichorick_00296 [Candidatus Trichorickettsia mobilis]|uniref:Lipoprotein n=1 Tax=Candidatus Trichorickettsia mobilis TaxID=1346319 RepID=A0ABZ0UQU4_9RICK|nr:hypothetical protein Trichorick_00296 [Candidatus Trichorickettsia mobilis]